MQKVWKISEISRSNHLNVGSLVTVCFTPLQSIETQTDDQLMRELEHALYSRKRPSESSLIKQAHPNGADSPHSRSGSYQENRDPRRRGSKDSRNGASSQRNDDPYRNDERINLYENEAIIKQHQQQKLQQQQQQQAAPPPPVRRNGSNESYQEEPPPPPYNSHNRNPEFYGNNHSSPVEVHHAKDDHVDMSYRNGEMQRRRLPGMSGADALAKELQNHPMLANQAVVNAIVENDRQHSPPPSSQNSRTESAQGGSTAAAAVAAPSRHAGGAGPDPHARRESDSASRLSRGSQGESPQLSLEADQVSDYDNQPPSDLDVNLESEADLRAAATGDKDLVDQDPDTSPVEDSSECDSTSSSTGVEQMLFSKLKTNPKVTSLQNMHILDNSYNEWDTQPPNYDPYAFNPYAIDDDYIKNPLLHGKHPAGLSRHRRHTSLSELQDRLLQHLTDDTDATPV